MKDMLEQKTNNRGEQPAAGRSFAEMNRRAFMASGAAAAAVVALNPLAMAEWAPSERYPDPNVQVIDPSFAKYKVFNSGIERLATGMRWCEGPVYFPAGRYLLWSDIPNDRVMKWEEETGAVSVFRKPSNKANGSTRDRQGRYVTCEHEARRVTRTEYDGTITVLMDSFEGKRLNSPNDIVVKSDDSIWFTDPPFGTFNWYEGTVAKPELPFNVYRIDGKTGKATVATGDIKGPNGLGFSPDESKLYICENMVSPRLIRVFDVVGNGTKLANNRVYLDAGPGTIDGFRVDVDGNLWCGWGMGSEELDGVSIFSPQAKLIGHIKLPERCANLCFGGLKRNRLFMASAHSIYSVYVNTQGALGG
ncbi:MAG: SMP-30/gluconolactonase/LRE family protein [Candidatus Korobacteraceae bacterium]|jgi:gluconolactonase